MIGLVAAAMFSGPALGEPRTTSRNRPAAREAAELGAQAAAVGEPIKEMVKQLRSVSCGWPHRGRLLNPAVMPRRGYGFVIPEPWRTRGLRYGTDELVGLLKRAAA